MSFFIKTFKIVAIFCILTSSCLAGEGEGLRWPMLRNVTVVNQGDTATISASWYIQNFGVNDTKRYAAYEPFNFGVVRQKPGSSDNQKRSAQVYGGPKAASDKDCEWYNCATDRFVALNGETGTFSITVTELTGTLRVVGLCAMANVGDGSGGWSSPQGTNYDLSPIQAADQMCPASGGGTGAVTTKDWCAFDAPEPIIFDFGALKVNDINSVAKTVNTNVYCTYSNYYQVKLQNPIKLTNGLTVNILAGGKSLGTNLTANTGNNSLVLSASLSGTPVSTGPFSGQGVLSVNIP